MNPVSKALEEITWRIPREILEIVFIRREQNWRDLPLDLKEMINNKVVRPRVLVDCNLHGGTEVRIPLEGIKAETIDQGYTNVYRIPKKLTNNRRIMSVYDVTYASLYQNLGSYGSNAIARASPAMQLGSAVMEAQLRIPYTSTAKVQLIGENVVMVQDSILLPVDLYLRCQLENEENLNNIQVRSWPVLSELMTLAVKAYIYNTYIVKLDLGEIQGGVAIGRIKEIIEGYADAEVMYQECLAEKWQKVAFMNDGESMTRFIALLVGGTR